MPTVDQLIEVLKQLFHLLGYLLILSFFIVGICVAVRHVKEFLADHWIKRFRKKDFRVKETIIKDILGKEQTQRAKLRRLRVSKAVEELVVDPWPLVIPGPGKAKRKANVLAFYSMPGRLSTEEADPYYPLEKKFRLILERDEALKPHREYSTLLVYVVSEKIDELLSPPGFTALQPVGTERFTYEIHFPTDRRYVRDEGNLPKIKIYTTVLDKRDGRDKESELVCEPSGSKGSVLRRSGIKLMNAFRPRYHVIGGRTNFLDRSGEHDWFRVTILKPPQRRSIHIRWCMEGDVYKGPWCSHTDEEHKKT